MHASMCSRCNMHLLRCTATSPQVNEYISDACMRTFSSPTRSVIMSCSVQSLSSFAHQIGLLKMTWSCTSFMLFFREQCPCPTGTNATCTIGPVLRFPSQTSLASAHTCVPKQGECHTWHSLTAEGLSARITRKLRKEAGLGSGIP